jgi:hypothetical protein
MSRADAPVPDTIEGLRAQNRAYRALCASLEAQMKIGTEQGRKSHEAVTTLDSEREANAQLTAEVDNLRAALSAMILEHDAGGITLATMREARELSWSAPSIDKAPIVLGTKLSAEHAHRIGTAVGYAFLSPRSDMADLGRATLRELNTEGFHIVWPAA